MISPSAKTGPRNPEKDQRCGLRIAACLLLMGWVLGGLPARADPDPTPDDGPLVIAPPPSSAQQPPAPHPVATTYLHAPKPKAKKPAALPSVSIRAGDHKGLSRVLISWHTSSSYKIDETPGLVTITFSRAAKPDMGNVARQTLRNIQSVSIGDDPDHLVVKLAVKAGSKARAFKTGNIVVVDILDSTEPPPQSAPPATQAAASAAATPVPPDEPAANALAETIIHIQPSDTATSLAVFRRGPYLWLATDDKIGEGATTATGPLAKDLGPPTRYSLSNGSLVRYAYKPDDKSGQHISTRVHAGGWDVVISPAAATTPALAVKAVATENEVTISAPGAMHVLSFTDPDLGDTLYVVPLPVPGEYVGKMRRYSDADLLATAQGVAAVARGDRAQIGAGLGAVTISGVTLSSDSGTGVAAPPLFDLAGWYRGGPSALLKNRRAIEHEGIKDGDSSGGNERSRAIDMARLFLANGWGHEALGALNLAQDIDADVAASPDFIALRGGAEALSARPDDAVADLTIDALAGQPEAILWRALAESSGTADQRQEAFSILRSNTTIFDKYPHELKQKFSLALAALAVEANDQATMEAALKLLVKGEAYDQATIPAITTLKAALALQKGKIPDSNKLYDSIPALRDQYWTAIAALAQIEGGLAQGTLTQKDAIAKLDPLHYAWRGDDYEYRVLAKMGELYLATNDYKDGLETLTTLMTVGENTKYADDARQKVIDTAKLAFSPETAAASSPLDMYELYKTFLPYLPPHTISDADIRNLSDRLAVIGVMDQAIELIQPQMDSATDPTVKAKLGARIAALRLLDDKPDLALKALAASDFSSIDDTLKTERKLLQARALFKAGKPDDAIAALQGLQSREADALRVEIAWAQKDWKDAASALSRLAGPPPTSGDMTDEQANIVLNEAVALSLAGDTVGLQQLAKTFGDPMGKTKKGSAFALLTSPESDMNSPSVESVKASVNGLDIFENYLSAYRKEPAKG